MASQFDESDFVDGDYQSTHSYSAAAATVSAGAQRPPSREELDNKVTDAQQRLAELRRAQEQLERERGNLEEARRRRHEFEAGRAEMLEYLARGVVLLKEAEFHARREAEQMAKTLGGLEEALGQVHGINEQSWTQETWNTELARALAAVENARMEWNGARLKWPLLDRAQVAEPSAESATPGAEGWLAQMTFWRAFKLGAALSLPVVIVGVIAMIVAVVLQFT